METNDVVNGAGWMVLTNREVGVLGHVQLTVRVHFDDGFYVGVCPELGVPSFGDSLDEAFHNTIEATVVYLNAVEESGERERIFAERGLKLLPGEPHDDVVTQIDAHPDEYIGTRSLALVAG